jgi:hypothetical protein
MLVNSITGTIQATILEGRMRHAGHVLASPVVAIGIHWIPGSHCAQRLILQNTPTCKTDRLVCKTQAPFSHTTRSVHFPVLVREATNVSH